MEEPDHTSTYEPDKDAIDASAAGSLCASAEAGSRAAPADIGESLSRLIARFGREQDLILRPLRLMLLTAELGSSVNKWNRAHGLVESGVSQQPEGIAAAKTFS
jgi:hypothetical protein